MTRTLILTRHAKSAWDDPNLDDFDRPLNGRGRKSAVAIGAWLRTNGHVPDEVLVSGARRTVDTWARMAPDMPASTVMRSEPAMYHAGPETLLTLLQGAIHPTVMMISHNPGIAEFAGRIVVAAPDHARFHDYPTAATTVMTFDTDDWRDVHWRMGEIAGFVIPRDLLE